MRLLFFVNTLIKSTTLVFGFIISLVLTYYMGAQALGFYVLYITLVNLLLIFVKFGQDRYLLKEIAKEKALPSLLIDTLSFIILTCFITILIAVLLQWLGVMKVPKEVNQTLFLLALFMSLLGGGTMAVFIAALRGKNKVTKANFFESVPLNLSLLIVIVTFGLFTGFDHQLLLLVFGHGIISLVIAAVLLLFFNRISFSSFVWSKTKFYNHFKNGLPFALITGATVLNTSIDTLSINYYLTLEDIAHYNVALKLSSLVQFGLIIGTSLIANRFSLLFEQQKTLELRAALFTVIKISSTMAFSILIVIIMFTNEIVSLWGDDFDVAIPALIILSVAQLVNVFFGPLGVLLSMTGKEKQVLVGTIFALLINLFLTVQFVPDYGISGAAIATACAIIIQNCIFLWLIKNNNILKVET